MVVMVTAATGLCALFSEFTLTPFLFLALLTPATYRPFFVFSFVHTTSFLTIAVVTVVAATTRAPLSLAASSALFLFELSLSVP